ncbi:MAG: hypothetical protein CMH85_18400 [Novosphingobium sp.]|nr:hypothetical protein [Novosphingobium sp.]
MFASILRFPGWTLLLLAAIGLQAAEPIQSPLERTHGSAFSASTLELALVSGRRADTASPVVVTTPALPITVGQIRPVAHVTHFGARNIRWRPEVRGPPPRAHPARRPDSTAPPQA